MATFRLVLSGDDGVLEVGVVVLRPDGTGTCSIRLPYRGELAVVPAANDDDEVTVPAGGPASH